MYSIGYLLLTVLAFTGEFSHISDDKPHTVWSFTDIEGKPHRPFADTSTTAIVVIFITPDCPIANSYQPLLRHMADKYSEHGIEFFMIHPRTTTTIEQALKHQRDFEIKTPVVLDSDQVITRRLGATVTPQAFVYVDGQTDPIYQGRIDNRYADFGRKRAVATSRELESVLETIRAGEIPKTTRTAAVGCRIVYAE